MKLKISQPDDPYEREAERVAEQVVRIPSNEQLHLGIRTLNNKKINRKV